ncbi:MAG: carbamoyl-phosphate synthase large subunit [Clostridiaceae bacterium]|nr:carbamoyl-phosphate synthase large subunit [Clostridiaceae bacterium]
MPLDKSIKKVLVIGSGPIVIGQAAEFDYAGTQALRALKEDHIETVLVNSNPATIMTDRAMADHIYFEPLTLETLERIIDKEHPDSVLSGLGGQNGLTLGMQLAKSGFLESRGIRLLGANPETIDRAEDRLMFKETMQSIGQPCIPSDVVEDVENAVRFASTIGYPVIVRPAFTLGGSGGGIAESEEELREIAFGGLETSPIHQILVEKCISGWKEIEFEVMRDRIGNAITICSMENIDPVGIHTGDSIVVAPALTLADREYQMLRSSALAIVNALGVEGGCNVQFALHPTSFDYAVIEVNPRVSRSSALASKATGYPIAKVATKVAIGYTLDEIPNAVTKKTYAAFEPAIDYVAVKMPKWPFDKFVYAKRELGTQMKATGEVMAIAPNFEMGILKAVRGCEIGLDTLNMPRMEKLSDEELNRIIRHATDERLFAVYEALKRGYTPEDIHELSMIDLWFLYKFQNLLDFERSVKDNLTEELYHEGKRLGYPDRALERLSGCAIPCEPQKPMYKMVDTCAAEFRAETPYFYSTYDTAEEGGVNEAAELATAGKRRKVLVLGSGPIRIGQGIEFDYASVYCVWVLKERGYEVVIINNNPETVSTDFDTADRLYFEPLYAEDVMHIIRQENPMGVVVSFGGQTAIKLTKTLAANNIPIIGSSADTIDMAEDRERFDELLESLSIKRPRGHTVMTPEEALRAANDLGYPVLVRPSYVLGGQNMIIAYSDDDIREYMEIILRQKQDNPVLVDKYLEGLEIEVDAICDGEDLLMPGIMQHIERTGVHSGDSIAVYPGPSLDDELRAKVEDITRKLCSGLHARGLVNLQYIVYGREIYVIEVNPRASRTVPYLSKVTGVPMCELAVRSSLGETLSDLGYGTGLYKMSPYVTVKVPVFSFEKLTDVDTQLGPEMKSTGEVLGIGKNLREALFKGLVAAGYTMKKSGGVFLSVRHTDKPEIADIAKKYAASGFKLYATSGTAEVLRHAHLKVTELPDFDKNGHEAIRLLESGQIQYVISTSVRGRNPSRESVRLRRRAISLRIPCLTSLDTANAVADTLLSHYSQANTELVDLNAMRPSHTTIRFSKMQICGNDYIYINTLDQEIPSPESLTVLLSDRHFAIGGDGVVVIGSSAVADASMRIYNKDGSEGRMGGNAICCVAKYLYDNDIVRKRTLTIETLSGVKTLNVLTHDDRVRHVTVDMGQAVLDAKSIPIKINRTTVINEHVTVAGGEYSITCVSMGNPHCVVFVDETANVDVPVIGPKFENDPLFPQRVNTEFVEVVNDHTLKMRVWERGNGETLACGTGACAAVVAAVENGYCKKDTDIRVIVLGGDLYVRYSDATVTLSGEVIKVYDGVVEI